MDRLGFHIFKVEKIFKFKQQRNSFVCLLFIHSLISILKTYWVKDGYYATLSSGEIVLDELNDLSPLKKNQAMQRVLLFPLLNSFIKIQFICHIFYPFKVYNSIAFSIVTVMCNHHHGHFCNSFITSKRNTLAIYSPPLSPPQPLPPPLSPHRSPK